MSRIEGMTGRGYCIWNYMKVSYLRITKPADVADFLQRYFHQINRSVFHTSSLHQSLKKNKKMLQQIKGKIASFRDFHKKICAQHAQLAT